jgi:glucosamine-6-phosphate deaminase
MDVIVSDTKTEMGQRAADAGAAVIRRAIESNGEAHIILATGASQFEMYDSLVAKDDIDWSKVTVFHLDEYIGMPVTHNASFRKYLKERFVERIPEPIGQFHYIDAEEDPEEECERLNALISRVDIDVAFIGIGENGHIAFNDPPADFETEEPYIIVELDEDCRRQQMGEGWFDSLSDVPKRAISMSVRQIMKSNYIVCTVPDDRKAEAVKNTLEGPVTPEVPASILQEHPNCDLFLDKASASQTNQYA